VVNALSRYFSYSIKLAERAFGSTVDEEDVEERGIAEEEETEEEDDEEDEEAGLWSARSKKA